MRVLLTGHDGYIGSVLGPRLAEAGHDVINLDTLYFEECRFGAGPARAPGVRKDIRDVVEADLAGFDAVMHLAALSNDPRGNLNPKLTYEINHAASVRLARIALASGVRRFIYSSSCSIYGIAGDDLVTEDAPLRPLTPYSISKARTEDDLAKLASDTFSPVFLRNATAYGVSPRFRADLVLNNLVCWAYATGNVRLMGDGKAWRPVIHVEDIARAFQAALTAKRDAVHNQAFNVGIATESYRVRDLAEIAEATVPGSTIAYGEGRDSDLRSYRIDFRKLERTLPEFSPRWNARRGAEQLYAAFQRVGLTSEDFQGPKYVRMETIERLLQSGQLDADLRWRS